MDKRNIQRLATAIALLLAVNMNVDAQLGGLLNKAKEVAKGVVQGDVQGAIQQQIANTQADMVRQQDAQKKMKELRQERAPKELEKQAELGQTGLPSANLAKGDVDFYLYSGQHFGIYHSKTKTIERFVRDADDKTKWVSFNFSYNDNGTIVSQEGVTTGIINPDGSMRSAKTDGVRVDKEGLIYWNDTHLGSVNHVGEIRAFGSVVLYCYSEKPVDPKIATYLAYCDYLDNKTIGDYLKIRKQDILTPGSLHAQHHDAALASIKRRIPQAQDVVITSNDWRIIRDNLGNIISRACDGWYIIKNGTGRRAISYCWRQQYMGGGQYGNLEASTANGFDPIDLE